MNHIKTTLDAATDDHLAQVVTELGDICHDSLWVRAPTTFSLLSHLLERTVMEQRKRKETDGGNVGAPTIPSRRTHNAPHG